MFDRELPGGNEDALGAVRTEATLRRDLLRIVTGAATLLFLRESEEVVAGRLLDWSYDRLVPQRIYPGTARPALTVWTKRGG